MLKRILGFAPKEVAVSEDSSVHQSEPEIVATQTVDSEVVINDIPMATEESVPTSVSEATAVDEGEVLSA